jgi:hypothetical protein
MRRLLVVTVAIGALLAAFLVPANAATKKKAHKINAAVLLTQLGSATSGTITLVGVTQGPPIGRGMLRVDGTLTGSVLTSKVKFFGVKGTMRGAGTASFTMNPDQSFSYTGSGSVTGGTGAYKGAVGKLTLTGTQAANDNIIHVALTGTVKY